MNQDIIALAGMIVFCVGMIYAVYLATLIICNLNARDKRIQTERKNPQ